MNVIHASVISAALIGGLIGGVLGGVGTFLIEYFFGKKLKNKTKSIIVWSFVLLGYAIYKSFIER